MCGSCGFLVFEQLLFTVSCFERYLKCACLVAGEMVLLLHWSMLNYAAVVKILKKHGEPLVFAQKSMPIKLQCSRSPAFMQRIKGWDADM